MLGCAPADWAQAVGNQEGASRPDLFRWRQEEIGDQGDSRNMWVWHCYSFPERQEWTFSFLAVETGWKPVGGEQRYVVYLSTSCHVFPCPCLYCVFWLYPAFSSLQNLLSLFYDHTHTSTCTFSHSFTSLLSQCSHRSQRQIELENDFDRLTSVLKQILNQVKVINTGIPSLSFSASTLPLSLPMHMLCI